MNLIQLCQLATPVLAGMAKEGKLRPHHVWTALEGAQKYREAVVKGDVADEIMAQMRAEFHCARCPSSVRVDKAGIQRMFCGEPFVDRTNTALPTCGCLVGAMVDGSLTAAGKTVVASQECPQAKWGAVRPTETVQS